MISPRETLLAEAAAQRKILLKLMARKSKDFNIMRDLFNGYMDHTQAAEAIPMSKFAQVPGAWPNRETAEGGWKKAPPMDFHADRPGT